jgi:hypothetical protein
MAHSATKINEKNHKNDTFLKSTPKPQPKKKGRGVRGEPASGQKNLIHQPLFIPTDADRTVVKLAAAIGYSQDQACRLVNSGRGVAQSTFSKYFGDEWAIGRDQVLAAVAGNLINIARSPTHPQAATSAIFILKTQLRWRTADPIPMEVEASSGPLKFTLRIGERNDDAIDV